MKTSALGALSFSLALPLYALLLLGAGCGADPPEPASRDVDSASFDVAIDLVVQDIVDLGTDAALGELDTGTGSDLDVHPEGLVLVGGFVPSTSVHTEGSLQLRGSFAASFAAEPSRNGELTLEHITLGTR